MTVKTCCPDHQPGLCADSPCCSLCIEYRLGLLRNRVFDLQGRVEGLVGIWNARALGLVHEAERTDSMEYKIAVMSEAITWLAAGNDLKAVLDGKVVPR